MNIEEWRGVVGLEDLYEVSSHGRLRGIVHNSSRRKRLMSIRTGGRYAKFCLTDRLGRRINSLVHRLVAQAFIPNPENLPCVNHKDSDRFNNFIENLEWVTHKQNTAHMKAAGRMAKQRGPAKLNEESVADIRSMLRSGAKLHEAALKHNVTVSNICYISTGKTWRHVA